jgi:cysteine desulfurase
MGTETYLDHGSAAPLDQRARRALIRALDAFGDPLRLHADGQAARRLLDDARASVAEGIGAQPDEIVFTSGGTESVTLAIWGAVRPIREIGKRVVTTAVEHPAVGGVGHTLEADGFEVVLVPVDAYGRVDLGVFAKEVRKPGTLLGSIQHANHEVGTLQPIGEAARLCREAKVLFHTDACQTVGRLPVDVGELDVDLLSLSAHKFGGPPGAGALFVRRGVPVAAYPCGDDRERKRRSGMENIPGVAGMAAALSAWCEEMADQAARQWKLSDRLREGIEERVPRARIHGHPTQRVPHLVCFSVPDLDAEILAMALDDRGFRLSVGSDCSGVASEPSPVLRQMGVPDTPSFRIGLGPDTSEDDIDRFLEALPALVAELGRVEAASSEAMAKFRSREEKA